MTIRLIIARHGNTFKTDEAPRRIGARTDLSLTDVGREQAKKLGQYFQAHNMLPDIVYTSRLKRTIETAEEIMKATDIRRPVHASDMFDEIDHGPDENKTDPDIVLRIGGHAFNQWERENIMPKDWSPQPEVIARRWRDFAKHCEVNYDEKTVLVVTSNGVARFAPDLANNAPDIITEKNRKMGTCAFSVFEGSNGLWMLSDWNIKPGA